MEIVKKSGYFENIFYNPKLQTTNDLEAATKTITATAEASGLANKDYSAALTLPAPGDNRLAVMVIASRIAVTIDSMTATHLYCKVYVDVQDADHLLFSEDFTSTGEKLDAVDTQATNKAIIYNLLKDGAAHTYYFYFWVDSGNAVMSVVQAWEAVGSCQTGYNSSTLELTHHGSCTTSCTFLTVGTGAAKMSQYEKTNTRNWGSLPTSILTAVQYCFTGIKYYISGSVATDINYCEAIQIILRSE